MFIPLKYKLSTGHSFLAILFKFLSILSLFWFDHPHWLYTGLTVYYIVYLVAQSCLILFNPMDCSLAGFSVHGDSPGKNIGVGCCALFQVIFQARD